MPFLCLPMPAEKCSEPLPWCSQAKAITITAVVVAVIVSRNYLCSTNYL